MRLIHLYGFAAKEGQLNNIESFTTKALRYKESASCLLNNIESFTTKAPRHKEPASCLGVLVVNQQYCNLFNPRLYGSE
jgi:hypothetical protein